MGINTDKLAEIYFILDHLDRQDLMDFLQEEYDDPSYTTDSESESEDEEDLSELVDEEITVAKTEEGFYKIVN
jgi:hypothetical protein